MKRRNNKGFTLIEMLIVVGIIAILVAVSIPMVSSSLERTKRATDAANERAAKAAAMIEFIERGVDLTDLENGWFYYDAVNGEVVKAVAGASGLGPEREIEPYGKCKDHKGCYLFVIFSDVGTCDMVWQSADGTGADRDPHLKLNDIG